MATNVIQGKNRFIVTSDPTMNGVGEAPIGSFKSVSGLSKEVETSEWKTGDMKTVAKLPGNTKFANISFKRGFDLDSELADWFGTVSSQECADPTVPMYRTVYIYVIDRSCNIFKKIKVDNAWPCKYEADELDSMSNDPWLETLEIAHSGWSYVDVPPLTKVPDDWWAKIQGAIVT